MSKKKKYQSGGAVALDTVSTLAPLLDLAVPGLGTGISALGAVGSNYINNLPDWNRRPLNVNTRAIGYKKGGHIPLSSDAVQVQGNPNIQDNISATVKGVPVKLDDDEVVIDRGDNAYVLSDSITDPNAPNMSLAKSGAKVARAKGKAEQVLDKNPYDKHAQNTVALTNHILNKYQETNERLKESSNMTNKYAQGGAVTDRPQNQSINHRFLTWLGSIAPEYRGDKVEKLSNPEEYKKAVVKYAEKFIEDEVIQGRRDENQWKEAYFNRFANQLADEAALYADSLARGNATPAWVSPEVRFDERQNTPQVAMAGVGQQPTNQWEQARTARPLTDDEQFEGEYQALRDYVMKGYGGPEESLKRLRDGADAQALTGITDNITGDIVNDPINMWNRGKLARRQEQLLSRLEAELAGKGNEWVASRQERQQRANQPGFFQGLRDGFDNAPPGSWFEGMTFDGSAAMPAGTQVLAPPPMRAPQPREERQITRPAGGMYAATRKVDDQYNSEFGVVSGTPPSREPGSSGIFNTIHDLGYNNKVSQAYDQLFGEGEWGRRKNADYNIQAPQVPGIFETLHRWDQENIPSRTYDKVFGEGEWNRRKAIGEDMARGNAPRQLGAFPIDVPSGRANAHRGIPRKEAEVFVEDDKLAAMFPDLFPKRQAPAQAAPAPRRPRAPRYIPGTQGFDVPVTPQTQAALRQQDYTNERTAVPEEALINQGKGLGVEGFQRFATSKDKNALPVYGVDNKWGSETSKAWKKYGDEYIRTMYHSDATPVQTLAPRTQEMAQGIERRPFVETGMASFSAEQARQSMEDLQPKTRKEQRMERREERKKLALGGWAGDPPNMYSATRKPDDQYNREWGIVTGAPPRRGAQQPIQLGAFPIAVPPKNPYPVPRVGLDWGDGKIIDSNPEGTVEDYTLVKANPYPSNTIPTVKLPSGKGSGKSSAKPQPAAKSITPVASLAPRTFNQVASLTDPGDRVKEVAGSIHPLSADKTRASVAGYNPSTMGDALQLLEVGSKFMGLAQGPQIEQLRQAPMYQIDAQPYLNQIQQAANAQALGLSTGSYNMDKGARQAAYSNQYSSTSDVLNDVYRTNVGLADQTSKYNLQQQSITADLNARNQAAYDQATQNAFTTVGNTGRAYNQKQMSQQAMEYLRANYPDVYDFVVNQPATEKKRKGGRINKRK